MFERFRAGTADKSPLTIAGDRRGVLCLHGITGHAVRGAAAGRALRAARLFGRGADAGGPRGDAGRPGGDALERLVSRRPRRRSGGLEARTGGGPTAICGFSMGGLLALRLARLYPARISALVVMSTPLRLRPLEVLGIRTRGAPAGRLSGAPAGGGPQAQWIGRLGSAIRYTNPGLRAFPIAALEGLLDLMDVVRPDLPGDPNARRWWRTGGRTTPCRWRTRSS